MEVSKYIHSSTLSKLCAATHATFQREILWLSTLLHFCLLVTLQTMISHAKLMIIL